MLEDLNDFFSTTRQKVFLFINVVFIIAYFITGLPGVSLYCYSVETILVFLIIPMWVIFITAPYTDGENKPTVIIFSIIMIIYYLYSGDRQIKGAEYIAMISGESADIGIIKVNMIIGIIVSCIMALSSLSVVKTLIIKIFKR